MYQDEILLLVSVIALAFFALLTTYLVASRKKRRLLKSIVKRGKIPFDALSLTMETAQSDGDSVDFAPVEVIHADIHLAATLPGTDESHDSRMKSVVALDLKPIENFDSKVLDGHYTMRGELKGGGMGRVFLARKNNPGNDWIVKYVPPHIGGLSKEADILKGLNHPSLPKIVDIFNDKGLYLVQSYIPGTSMQSALASLKAGHEEGASIVPELKLIDWAKQLTGVLEYLHTNKQPIFHFDIKPSNVMVSHGNKLSLIDFGISRRQSDDYGIEAVTFEYAAPEQLKKLPKLKNLDEQKYVEDVMESRFGGFANLPDARKDWPLDERTDIYSLGCVLFEAAVGEFPTISNRDALRKCISKGLCDIIEKCLKIDPSDRYQSAQELNQALDSHEHIGIPGIFAFLQRCNAATLVSAILMPIAVLALISGMFVRTVEAAAAMHVNPEILTISVRQSSEIQITRVLPEVSGFLMGLFVNDDGEQTIDPNQLRWDATANNIVQVDGNRIVGLQVGETLIRGQYRMQDITMRVNVVEPIDGLVEVSMRYRPGHLVQLFAGTGSRRRIDGKLSVADFDSPASMDIAYNGSLYFTDSGWLRRIQDGVVETIDIGPMYLRANLVRTYHNCVYILTYAWQDEDKRPQGIIRHTTNGIERLYIVDTRFVTVRDFVVAEERIYFIERNYGLMTTLLRSVDRHNLADIRTLTALPMGTSAIALGTNKIFLADEMEGTIMVFENEQLYHLAGVPEERGFVDGSVPLFYRPTRIQYHDSALYVWDFNVLRKLLLEEGFVRKSITLIGSASPEFSMDFVLQEDAENIIMPYSRLTGFAILEHEIFLSDPRRGVIWRFE